MTNTQQAIRDAARTAETIEMIQRTSTSNTDRLHLIQTLRTNVEWLERSVVAECRELNWTWQDIAEVLGVSRQAAQQRFSGYEPIAD